MFVQDEKRRLLDDEFWVFFYCSFAWGLVLRRVQSWRKVKVSRRGDWGRWKYAVYHRGIYSWKFLDIEETCQNENIHMHMYKVCLTEFENSWTRTESKTWATEFMRGACARCVTQIDAFVRSHSYYLSIPSKPLRLFSSTAEFFFLKKCSTLVNFTKVSCFL